MRFLLILLAFFLTHCGSPLEIDRSQPRKEFAQTSVAKNPWFKIIVLDVGQGDATLLIAPEGKAAIIDTGPKTTGAKAILTVLKEQSVETIQSIFISHHHEDHTGGLEDILLELAFDRSQVIDKKNAEVGQTIALGSATLQIKAANGQIGNQRLVTGKELLEENNLSLALLVQYGEFRYLTSGDLPGGGGDPPYKTIDLESSLAPMVGDVDIFLVPHHGSHTSSNENFLNTLTPEIAIISLGNQNDFFHPHPSVMERLRAHHIQIYQTERGWLSDTTRVTVMKDHICILSDGQTYEIKAYQIDKCSPPN